MIFSRSKLAIVVKSGKDLVKILRTFLFLRKGVPVAATLIRLIRLCALMPLFLLSASVMGQSANTEATKRFTYTNTDSYVVVEVKRDDLLHFETGRLPVRDLQRIWLSPMVVERNFPGPTVFVPTAQGFKTAEIEFSIDQNSLCARLSDIKRGFEIGSFCPKNLNQTWKQLEFDSQMTTEAYGLGQYFQSPGETDGNWIGRVWDPTHDSMGNMLRGFAGGANNFSMFPILYGLGSDRKNYGLFFDHVYKQMWDFRQRPFTIGAWGDQLRWMVFTGDDLPSLRQKYLALTGRPPVPPKRAFGLWVSEFGYENWDQVDSELASLRAERFPLDGFCMDLQWFGGTFGDPYNTGMGSLTWDERKFPGPETKIRSYRQQGIRLMLIEEPFISERLQEHRALADGGYMARDCANCGPTRLSHNPWWGYGGMVDFTSPAASDFWHDFRRQRLYNLGIRDHWLDLGEPEQYNAHAWYHGFPELGKNAHVDVHNIYNFRWVEGIHRGYGRNNNRERPFILSRSGTSGIQRFGAALWSGDTGTDWVNLGSQMQTQMHMSLSGLDYYGSDTGGFQRSRGGVEGGTESLYTQWLAYSSLFEVPVRPHAWNLDKTRSTSPAKRGDVASNLANVRQRYELLPYYYSLAFRAWLFGEPVFPPAFFYDQSDVKLRSKGHLKMIGRDLLAVTPTSHFGMGASFYLPRGSWYNYHTNDVFQGGLEQQPFPVRINDVFQLPLFVRAGAIIPVQTLDPTTDRHIRLSDTLSLKVYAGPASEFILYEDDGETTDVTAGLYVSTKISQRMSGDEMIVVVDAAQGSINQFPNAKTFKLDLVIKNKIPTQVRMANIDVPRCIGGALQVPCYEQISDSVLRLHGGSIPVRQRTEVRATFVDNQNSSAWAHFVCDEGITTPGTSVYILGDDPVLGAWNPERAVLLRPTAYPVWSGSVYGLEPGKVYQWKCVKRVENSPNVEQWEDGPNRTVRAVQGFSGIQRGSF